MKVVILAGGLGTRLSEETASRPKPMVEIGERPILWHIMKTYSHYGFSDFVVCLGYKGYVIKEYFSNYFLHMSDVTFDMRDNSMVVHQNAAEPWRVTLVDTGAETQTGGRIKRVGRLRPRRDVHAHLRRWRRGRGHREAARVPPRHGKLATITAVQPLGRFGALQIDEDERGGSSRRRPCERSSEKPMGDGAWVNGGFFVLEPAVLDRIEGDDTPFEGVPLEGLAADEELRALPPSRASGSPWTRCATSAPSRRLWDSGEAPWAVWAAHLTRAPPMAPR